MPGAGSLVFNPLAVGCSSKHARASTRAARGDGSAVRWSVQRFSGFQSNERMASVSRKQGESFWQKAHKSISTVSASGSSCPTRRLVTQMPIGVPKVPYRTPGEASYQWVDLWNVLYRERIMFIGEAVTEELGNQLVGTMLYLDSVSNKDLSVYINSPGGEVTPCLAIYDTIKHMKSDVPTVTFGGAMAMTGFLLACGAKGKRYTLPNSKIMIHAPSGSARGQAADIKNEATELLRLRKYIFTQLAAATDKPLEVVSKDFSRDKYFTPETAQEYGIIDKILRPRRNTMGGLGANP